MTTALGSALAAHRRSAALLVLLGACAAAALPNLADPPLGRDGWRESDVLIVGRNFCREQAPLWLPRIDARGDTSGVTGMELPLLNYLAGQAACRGLDQVIFARAQSLLFTLAGLAALFLLAERFLGLRGAALAALAFAFSPVTRYYGRAIQPDLPALACALWSLLLMARAVDVERRVHTGAYLLSAGAIALGGLIKLPVLVFGLPLLWTLVERADWRRLARRPVAYLYPVLALAPPLTWYLYARHLQALSGDRYFFLGAGPAQLLHDWLQPSFYQKIFVQQLFDVYAAVPVSLLALATLLLWRRKIPAWLVAASASVLIYFFLAGHHVAHHYYYGAPAVPVIALLFAAGGGAAAAAAAAAARLELRAARSRGYRLLRPVAHRPLVPRCRRGAALAGRQGGARRARRRGAGDAGAVQRRSDGLLVA